MEGEGGREANTTERGVEVRIEGGFQYVMRKDRVGKNGERTWRCRDQRKYRCSASIKTLNGQILEGPGQILHSHVGDPIMPEVMKVQSLLRTKANTSHDTTRSTLAEYLVGLNQNVLQRLPRRTSLEDNIRDLKEELETQWTLILKNWALKFQRSTRILFSMTLVLRILKGYWS